MIWWLPAKSRPCPRDERLRRSEGVCLDNHRYVRAYANTHGFRGSYVASTHALSCTLLAEDSAGGMERDQYYTRARDPADLESPHDVAVQASLRTVNRLGARTIKTERLPVLFSPEMARGLWGDLMHAISGSVLYQNASFLKRLFGEIGGIECPVTT